MLKIVKMQEAKKIISSHKLVFVDFFTTRCYPCSLLTEKIEKNASMFEGHDNVAFVKVNIDDDKKTSAWAASFGMDVIPTIAVFVDGKQIRLDYVRDGENLKDQQCIVGNFDEAVGIIESLIKKYA